MKFVAKVPFHNAKVLSLDSKALKLSHPAHIHKGCAFELGGEAKSLKGITSNETKELVALLVLQGFVVVDDGTPESIDAIKAINAEVEAELKAAQSKEDNAPVSVQDQIAELQKAVVAMTAALAKK